MDLGPNWLAVDLDWGIRNSCLANMVAGYGKAAASAASVVAHNAESVDFVAALISRGHNLVVEVVEVDYQNLLHDWANCCVSAPPVPLAAAMKLVSDWR